MWTIFKVFPEFATLLLLFYVLVGVFLFVFWPRGMWDLSSPTRNQTHWLTRCIGRGSLNHRTTGKFLYLFLRTAVTKNHELGSLDDRKVWSCNSQAGRPRPWVWAGLVPSAAVQAPEAFLAGLSMGVFALGLHVACPLCISTPVSRFPFFIRAQVCWIKARTDNLILTQLSL